MNTYTRRINKVYLLVLIIAYVVGIDVFVCLKMLGIQELTQVNEQGREALLPLATCMALIIALGIAWMELNVFARWKTFSFGKFVIIKYGITVLLVTACCILVFIIYLMTVEKQLFSNAISEVPAFLNTGIFLSILFFVILFSVILNMIVTIYEYLGPRAIIGALLGKYSQPSEEDLTFLFIDLKSSTTIAERMGHSQYSRFIQESFQLLTDSIYHHDATIYQFVGDSAVLLWPTTEACKTLSPLELYFDFVDNIEQNNKHFLKHFGELPRFKAAIHTGPVTITEIQTVKKDIVYHGDVLNTCARILEQCSVQHKNILVSSTIAEWILKSDKFSSTFVQQLPLRGKTAQTAIYSIDQHATRI